MTEEILSTDIPENLGDMQIADLGRLALTSSAADVLRRVAMEAGARQAETLEGGVDG